MSSAGEWTTSGIALVQVSAARDMVHTVNRHILAGNEAAALDEIAVAIRQLEAARRMLRGF